MMRRGEGVRVVKGSRMNGRACQTDDRGAYLSLSFWEGILAAVLSTACLVVLLNMLVGVVTSKWYPVGRVSFVQYQEVNEVATV